ncbi:GNAT family N-acetyltransferase [Anabaena sp. UHCC 0187]|uniref:GNAT family N-acetyltransferase n=1 Tax=Anabaena sp. UHCC 0187 TaxID=2590018 RepID=UPI0014474C61|nr:GNAT family N-acetyltransferase [Anabaena sp. UHCC 0187]MTJ15068.1 GNAT family N-acetyltransferase [Anabaena sp. UHCC 0187]
MITNQVNLYDITNIDSLPWTNSEVAILAKNYWLPLMKAGSSQFINNVNSQLLAITIDDLVLPITVNHKELENSYVCSPYSHYITYSKEELYILKNPLLEKVLKILLNLMGIVLNFGKINQVVIVNNWLFSTNLYPDLSKNQIADITSYLKERFPTHTIIFRSINTFINDDLFKAFQYNNYQMIASRQIYLFNPKDTSAMRTKMRWRLKQDFNLIEKQGYEVINGDQICVTEVKRLVELYNALYLEKYSYNNPQFNENFLALALKNKTLQIQALRKAGKIDGVIGFYEINGVMTTPLLGYDTSLPQAVGLYRMLSAQLTIEATKRGIILHQSSGAASFKRLRGFIDNIEYSAVFDQHLSFSRQLVWRLLGLLVNKIAVPLIKKYKL